MLRPILLLLPFVAADIDYALECNKGYRVSAIRRAKTYYSVLGSLSIECERVSRPEHTTCVNQPSIPKCTGFLEGLLYNY
uniref:Secreted protein n=1 Tax=Heterorhabditis bacteriophora TaxID=37862 RepID=A0A1I7WRG8_HETBA